MNMKKRRIALVMALVMAMTMTLTTAVAFAQEIKVLVNGTAVTFDQPPVIENGRTLVPLRAIFEALGADVDWEQSTQTVTAIKGDITIILKIGDSFLTKSGERIALDVPAKIVGGRTLVPARAVAESFGSDVQWNQAARTVTIADGGSPSTSTDTSGVVFYEQFPEAPDFGRMYGFVPIMSDGHGYMRQYAVTPDIAAAYEKYLALLPQVGFVFQYDFIQEGYDTKAFVKDGRIELHVGYWDVDGDKIFVIFGGLMGM